MNKILYSFRVATKGSNKTTFKVEFRDIEDYKVIIDLSGIFENKFLKIMKGEYNFRYLDKKTEMIKVFKIDGKDPIKNLKMYINQCPSSFHLIATLKQLTEPINKEEATKMFEKIKKEIII